MKKLIIKSLDDDKAEMITTIDLRGRSSLADLMIVASGRSSRHLGAMADHLSHKLKQGNFSVGRMEGRENADWVLVDAGDIIVHLFQPDVRAFYNLEKLWLDPTLTPSSEKPKTVRKKAAEKPAAPKPAARKTVAKPSAKKTPAKSSAKKVTAEEMGNINRLKARTKKMKK